MSCSLLGKRGREIDSYCEPDEFVTKRLATEKVVGIESQIQHAESQIQTIELRLERLESCITQLQETLVSLLAEREWRSSYIS